MGSAAPLMNSVLEEKMQRIAEVLLGSIPPFQLMLGKLLGSVAVSLTTATVYLVGTYAALERAGYAQYFPWHLIWWFVVFQALAVLMFGSIFIAIGAAVTDLKEAQSMMTPVMLLLIAPMFVWFNVVREPNSTIALAMSLFPPITPMLMIVRQAVPPGVPVWQPLVAITLVITATMVCVFAAGRIFRVGMLMQGKGAKVSEMIRWAIRG
jgi:ABC-2 type transport system permease protein